MKSEASYVRTSYIHKQRTKKLRRQLLPISLLVVLLLFCGYGVASYNKNTPKPSAMSSTKTTSSQLTLDKNVQIAWPVNGQAAVADVEDGLLARASDSEKPQPTASMAKVITALAIMQKQPFQTGQQGRTYTINREDVANLNKYVAEDGSVLPLLIGTRLTQYQAMERMLMASDDNMADILAGRVFGSKEAYVLYANNMLKNMGLSQTVVTDASGFDPATVSTPSELVTIGIAALRNPVIAEIVARPQAQLPDIGSISNTNQLLGTAGVVGIKTGTTDEAGSCLLFAARYANKAGQERTLVGVIMGDIDHPTLYSDSSKLLGSAKQSFGLAETWPAINTNTPSSGQRMSLTQRQ